jgi:Fusaric acid resistance protein-like
VADRGRLVVMAVRWRPRRLTVTDLWLVLQQTAAGTVAWLVATYLVHHHEPFFAPIAAVVALNTQLGERGLNALRLLLGVLTGIAVGEVALGLLGSGYVPLALSLFVAMAAARAFDAARIVTAQAASAAILTVATASGEGGPERLGDALIGAGVALVFSQLLFTPRPVALLQRSEEAALHAVAEGLTLTARAVEGDDEALAEQAVAVLRDLGGPLSELARTRRASRRVVAHSPWWRGQKGRVVRESENAGVLDLLGGSALMLARTALTTRGDRDRVAGEVRVLAQVIRALSAAPGEREVRQRAAAQLLAMLGRVDAYQAGGTGDDMAGGALVMVAVDVLSFTGLDPE